MGMANKYLVRLFAAMTVAAVVPAWALTPTEVDQLLVEESRDAVVAVDGNTAVVGAPGADEGQGAQSGAAYVFTRSTGGWTRQAKLLADDGGAWHRFGTAVAIDGDTIVVGKRTFSGAPLKTAYVFTRTDGTWSHQATLVPDDGGSGVDDASGGWIAIDGDTIVVGDSEASGFQDRPTGAAYVFTRSSGVWTQQVKLTADDGFRGDHFGTSVAIEGNTALIGAPYETVTDPDIYGTYSFQGSAYVFTRSSGGWTQQAKLTADERSPEDYFGRSVALDGDTAVIGIPGDGIDGSAYVFTTGSGVWTQQAKLIAADARGTVASFGNAVALDGDTAVIGAVADDDQSHSSGSAYVFNRNDEGWTQRAKLLASNGASEDRFGGSVALSGDAALIRASRASGAIVYEFSLTPEARIITAGDVNADGVTDLTVVTPDDEVIVKDLAGNPINRFSLGGLGEVVDVELMTDIDANAAPELVALGWVPYMPVTAEVRDLLTGQSLSSVTFDPGDTLFDLEVVADQTGNGIPELAVVNREGSRNRVLLQIEDALGAQTVNRVTLSSYLRPEEVDTYPDVNANGVLELAVLSDNSSPDRNDPIEIRDPLTENLVQQIWLGKGWSVLEQALIADLNGNGAREVAVLRVRSGAVNVLLRDTLSGAWLGSQGFNPDFPPLGLVVVPDVNGNGTDELVVLGRRFDGANQNAVVKDSGTGAVLNKIWFDKNAVGEDVTTVADINGNGAAELVLLGRRARDDTRWAIVKDMATGERLARVRF